jgi:hypothetical protein
MAFDDWLKEGTIPPPGQTPREMMNEWSPKAGPVGGFERRDFDPLSVDGTPLPSEIAGGIALPQPDAQSLFKRPEFPTDLDYRRNAPPMPRGEQPYQPTFLDKAKNMIGDISNSGLMGMAMGKAPWQRETPELAPPAPIPGIFEQRDFNPMSVDGTPLPAEIAGGMTPDRVYGRNELAPQYPYGMDQGFLECYEGRNSGSGWWWNSTITRSNWYPRFKGNTTPRWWNRYDGCGL